MLHYMDMEEALYTVVKLNLSPIDITSEPRKYLDIVTSGYELAFGGIGYYPTQFHVYNDILKYWMFWVETYKPPLKSFIKSRIGLR
jgi:hypothetical protein